MLTMKSQLRLWSILLVLLPTIVITAIVGYTAVREAERVTFQDLGYAAELQTAMIDAWVADRLAELHLAASMGNPFKPAGGGIPVAALAGSGAQTFTSIILAGPDGKVLLSARGVPAAGSSIANEDFFRAVATTGRDYCAIARPNRYGGRAIIFAVPRLGTGGAFAGVLAATSGIGPLDLMLGRFNRGRTGETYLVDEEGIIFSQTRFPARDPAGVQENGAPVQPSFPSALLREAWQNNAGVTRFRDYKGDLVLAAYLWSSGRRWLTVVQLAEEEAFANLPRQLLYVVAGAAAVLIVVLPLALAAARAIRQPIEQLYRASRMLQSGIQEYQIDPAMVAGAPQELRELCETFNAMSRQIAAWNQTLEERVAERTAMWQNANQELQQTVDALKRTRAHLINSEKLASLGRLVAGIAHEVNTPVGIGVTAASHLAEKTREVAQALAAGELRRSELERFLDHAGRSADILLSNLYRAAELISGFKQVAVDRSSEIKRSFGVRKYLEEVLLSLQPKLKKTSIKVILDCSPDLEIISYPGALSQIITNLVINSLLHAFEPGESGTIRISAALAGEKLVLGYADTGKGMDENVRAQIFEPFFTTRRGSGGDGLGMYIVYNLVVSHLGGAIDLDTAPGQGVNFTIEIPVEIPSERKSHG